MIKLIGFKRVLSEGNRKSYCLVYVVKDFSEREKQSGWVGNKVDTFFMPDKYVNLLKESDIGKELVLDYEISRSRAYLVNVCVK